MCEQRRPTSTSSSGGDGLNLDDQATCRWHYYSINDVIMTDPEDNQSAPVSSFMTPADLALLSAEQKGFVCCVSMLEGEMPGASLIGDQVKTALAELLPPAALFGPEITALPYVRRELRKWLDSRGANLQQQSSHHFVMTLATSLNKDAEDRVVATQMASALVAESHRQGGGSSATAPPSPAARGDTASSGGDRTAHNIAMRFRDPSVKFSGNLGVS